MSEAFSNVRSEHLQMIKALNQGIPDTMRAFSQLGQAAYASGAIETKVKELIALAIAIADRCDACIAFHARSALSKGATREEVLETIAVAIQMGGGPSMVYGGHALEAYDEFAQRTTHE